MNQYARWIALFACLCAGWGVVHLPSLAQSQAESQAQSQAPSSASTQEAVRPEVGVALQAARELMKAGKHKLALAKLRETDALTDRTPYENFILDRVRGSAAAGAGDDATAIRSFEDALASGRLSPTEQRSTIEDLAAAAYRTKDYAKTIESTRRHFAQGGTSAQMLGLSASARYLGGDYAGVVRELQARLDGQPAIAADEKTLRLMVASQAKLGNDAGYASALERLLVQYPSKAYWADRLARLQNQVDFADRLTLDLLRLQFATDTLDGTEQYVEMTQLALRAGLPAEARRVVEAGYAAGKLGSGVDAARHQQLREVTIKQSADDEKQTNAEADARNADAMVALGQSWVMKGQFDKGIALMQQGLAKGGLKRLDDAQLHLGQAWLMAGKTAPAIAAFKSVRGSDGAADLARLWAIRAARP